MFRWRIVTAFIVGLYTIGISPGFCQSVCLPLPRLLTTMPMGGQVGTEFELSITGENLEEAGMLFFSHPGITANAVTDEKGDPVANRYRVAIAEDCPAGLYEARVLSRLGVSSARVFSVGTLAEVTADTPRATLETAFPLPINTVCNAVASDKSIDHYTFEAQAGQRFVIHCSSRSIDSKLDPVVIVGDREGRDLVVNRLGDSIDFRVENAGTYTIKVHELTFKGGAPFFYRLTLQELTGDASLPVFPSTKMVQSFSWPPQGLPELAATDEAEPNDDKVARRLELPCDVAGSFFPAADVDRFEFMATKGDVWWIEVASDRLGRPTDPNLLIQHVRDDAGNEVVTDVLELTDIASPVKPSSNGYAYDGPPYNGGSLDILGKLEIKEDGLYRLTLTDLFGGTRNDQRNVYRLVIRKAAPDFAVAAWGLHMELRNGDRNALSKPVALRPGATVALEVVAVRRDGFDGPIALSLEGLPAGVSATGLQIPAGQNRGMMLITANEHAPPGWAMTTFSASATIGDSEVQHPVQMADVAWPIPDSWGEIPYPRLVDGLPVSVTDSEIAPLTIATQQEGGLEAVEGTKLSIPLKHVRRSDFSGTVLQLRTMGAGFEQVPRFDISLTEDQSTAEIDLAALKVGPGDYCFAFYGAAVAKYQYNPNAAEKTDPRDTVDIVISEPITLRVKKAE